jgi:hypothetical protein
MSFLSKKASRYGASPVNLYLVEFGSTPNAYTAYTDSDQPVTFNGKIYAPIPIARGNVVAQGNLDKSTLQITTPINTRLAEQFRVFPPSQVVRVTIYEGDVEENEYLLVWTGRILSCRRTKSQAEFTCEPVTTMLKRVGLRQNYQIGCAHVLYGPQCLASQSAGTITRTIEQVLATKIVLGVGWNSAILAEKYINGMISWENQNGREYRTILKIVNGQTLNLGGPTSGLVSGSSVDVILGCNHQMNDCLSLHNNIHNYGGQPFIPLKNPINTNPYS